MKEDPAKAEDTKKEKIVRLLKEGHGVHQTARMVGASEEWTYKCQLELIRSGVKIEPSGAPARIWTLENQVRWVRYVNVIRTHFGMEPMEEPKFDNERR